MLCNHGNRYFVRLNQICLYDDSIGNKKYNVPKNTQGFWSYKTLLSFMTARPVNFDTVRSIKIFCLVLDSPLQIYTCYKGVCFKVCVLNQKCHLIKI